MLLVNTDHHQQRVVDCFLKQCHVRIIRIRDLFITKLLAHLKLNLLPTASSLLNETNLLTNMMGYSY